jgi:hypothetical protein
MPVKKVKPLTRSCAVCGKGNGGPGNRLCTVGSAQPVRVHQQCWPRWQAALERSGTLKAAQQKGPPGDDSRQADTNPHAKGEQRAWGN